MSADELMEVLKSDVTLDDVPQSAVVSKDVRIKPFVLL